MRKQLTTAPALLLFSFIGLASIANSQTARPIFAQKVIDEVAAKHPELNVLGLHVTPPNGSQNVIIASSIKEKVGKVSSPDDLDVIKTAKPSVHKMSKRKLIDIGLPLTDNQGTIIGMVVMEVKFSYTSQESIALKRAKTVVEELRTQLPTKEKLFEPAT